MLGKLARWLRMLGHDVTYNVELNDNELLELAKKETRFLLTKDLELYKRAAAKGINTFFVEGKSEPEMLAGVAERYRLNLVVDMEKSNCPVCNSKLEAAQKQQLFGELQKNTFTYYEKFWKCPNCGQIYWQGAHWKQISNTLSEAQKKLEKLKKKVEA
jgi:uncharacterized protein with PIN domain